MRGKIPSHGINGNFLFILSPNLLFMVPSPQKQLPIIAQGLFLFLGLNDLFSLVSATMGTDMVRE
jgi:hypothetical protein